MITKEEVEAVLECEITDERYEELLEASRMYSLSNSDKHVNLAQDAEHNQDWEGAKKHWKNAALASIKHDTVHKTQRSDKLKVRGITMRKEEVGQIDEKSKGNKRFAPSSDNGRHTVYDKQVALSGMGSGKAYKTREGARKEAERLNKTGLILAKTIRKEEVEQIDELSTEKKKQYIKRAEQSRDSHDLHVKHYAKAGRSVKKFGHHLKKGDKRTVGMLKAKLSIAKKDGSYSEAVEKEVNHYEIVNNHSKAVVGKAKTLKRARNIVDKKDNEYGGYAHFHRPVFKEAVELSASRKDKVNSLLAKHQAKGLPKKTVKKYTREYTGDGLPLIAAVINQEETLNETKE